MAYYKYSYLFQLTTSPQVRNVAIPHTAGWSESFWSAIEPANIVQLWHNVGLKRAAFLPKQAAIVGFRQQKYEIDGNKLIPGGASAGAYLYQSSPRWDCDQPQATLHIAGRADGTQNTASLYLRGIPDDFIYGGEYWPHDDFNVKVNEFFRSLLGAGAGFIGRDLTRGAVRVLGIVDAGQANDAAITTDAPIPGAVVNSFIRLNRVYDSLKRPVQGTFSVSAINGNVYSVRGLKGFTVTNPSGLVRVDALAFQRFAAFTVGRATVRKVGGPFERYRGRRSKR